MLRGTIQEQAMEWIKCEDRLPEEECVVLIWPRIEYSSSDRLLGINRKGVMYETDGVVLTERYSLPITHWMSLPDGPET